MNITAIKAASCLGMRNSAVAEFPERLCALGGLQWTQNYCECSPATVTLDLEQGTGAGTSEDLPTYLVRLASMISDVIGQDGFPVVIGGDPTVSLAGALALRRLTTQLSFVAFTPDYNLATPRTAPDAEIASMSKALLLGRGMNSLANIDGLGPYVRRKQLVLIGVGKRKGVSKRSVRRTKCYQKQHLRVPGKIYGALRQVIRPWRKEDDRCIWLELDLGVLARGVMPCTTSRVVGAMQPTLLAQLIHELLTTKRVKGMSVTGFDCSLDPNQVYLRMIQKLLNGLFGRPLEAQVA